MVARRAVAGVRGSLTIRPLRCTAGRIAIVRPPRRRLARYGQLTSRERMMTLSLTKLAPVAMVLVGSLGLGGCATKGFVRE